MRRRARWVMRLGFTAILLGLIVGFAGLAASMHVITACQNYTPNESVFGCFPTGGVVAVGAGGLAESRARLGTKLRQSPWRCDS